MKTALTIAGSDCSGGAGIQADIKTMTCLGVYAMSAITSLTAQNTTSVAAILDSTPEFLAQQLDCIFTDIFPDAVKTGMVSNTDLIEVIAERLKFYKAKNIVVDPVMVSTSGSMLMTDKAADSIGRLLFPLATLVTPNIPEGEIISEMKIETKEDMEKAAEKISRKYGCSVLLKGGHAVNDASDVLFHNGNISWYISERIDNKNTHGTGCTLSSAVAAFLAQGYELENAVQNAKDYLTGALNAGLDLGKGSGPLAHNYNIKKGLKQ